MSEFAFQKSSAPIEPVEENCEIAKLEKELEYFYKKRNTLLGIGIILLILGLASMVPIIIFAVVYLSVIPALIITGAIVVFVLRGALYNSRIKNRKNMIRELRREL